MRTGTDSVLWDYRSEDLCFPVSELADTLNGELDSDIRMVSFDRLVAKNIANRELLPKSTDAMFVCKDWITFVEFKNWMFNNENDEKIQNYNEKNRVMCSEVRSKASETVCTYLRFLKDRPDMKLRFVLVSSNPTATMRNILSEHAGKHHLEHEKLPDFLRKYQVRDTEGNVLFYDEVKYFSVRSFSQFLGRQNILFPDQNRIGCRRQVGALICLTDYRVRSDPRRTRNPCFCLSRRFRKGQAGTVHFFVFGGRIFFSGCDSLWRFCRPLLCGRKEGRYSALVRIIKDKYRLS